MKLNRAIILIIYINLLINIFSLKVKKDDVKKICEEIKKTRKAEEDSKEKPQLGNDPNRPSYMDLVVNPIRPKCPPVVNDPKAQFRDMKKYETGTFPTQGPYIQPNPFKIMSTSDTAHINYLFDFLDEMVIKKLNSTRLTAIIEKEFSESFLDAKKVKKTNLYYSNPYTPPKLLFYFSKGAAGVEPFTDPKLVSAKAVANNLEITPSGIKQKREVLKPTPDDAPVPAEIYTLIRSYNKKFDKSIFENGITPTQILNILNDWGWGPPGEDRDMMDVKKIVDTYDFNGDGNLNPEEFTIFQIHTLLKVGHSCQKHCLYDIIDKVLEPLFMYLDCDNDGYINSENMWEGLRNVYRAFSKKYNMFICKLPVDLNKDYRTNTVNDFILKASYAADGYLTKNEFIKGILSGFWERQVDINGYGNNETKTKGLFERWASNGTKDKDCEKILYYFNQ